MSQAGVPPVGRQVLDGEQVSGTALCPWTRRKLPTMVGTAGNTMTQMSVTQEEHWDFEEAKTGRWGPNWFSDKNQRKMFF